MSVECSLGLKSFARVPSRLNAMPRAISGGCSWLVHHKLLFRPTLVEYGSQCSFGVVCAPLFGRSCESSSVGGSETETGLPDRQLKHLC